MLGGSHLPSTAGRDQYGRLGGADYTAAGSGYGHRPPEPGAERRDRPGESKTERAAERTGAPGTEIGAGWGRREARRVEPESCGWREGWSQTGAAKGTERGSGGIGVARHRKRGEARGEAGLTGWS